MNGNGILQGFQAGYGMMDNYLRGEESKRRFDQRMGLQRQNQRMREESHDAQMTNYGLQQQQMENQLADYPAERAHLEKVRGLELETAQTQNSTANTRNNLASFQLDQAKLTADKKAKLGKLQAYYSSGRWDDFLQDKESFKGSDIELLQRIDGGAAALKLNESLQSQDTQGIVDSFNVLYKPKLNRNVGNMKGRDGGQIRDISVVGFELGPDGTAKMPVRVTTDKGSYQSYISELRGIDPKDKDKVFTVDELMGRAAGLGQLAGILKTSGAYDRLQGAAGNMLGLGAQSQPTAKQREWATIQQLFGPEKLQEYIFYSRQENPQQAMTDLTYKIMSDLQKLPQYMNTPPQELEAVAQQSALRIMQQGSGQQTAPANPALQSFQEWLKSSQQGSN